MLFRGWVGLGPRRLVGSEKGDVFSQGSEMVISEASHRQLRRQTPQRHGPGWRCGDNPGRWSWGQEPAGPQRLQCPDLNPVSPTAPQEGYSEVVVGENWERGGEGRGKYPGTIRVLAPRDPRTKGANDLFFPAALAVGHPGGQLLLQAASGSFGLRQLQLQPVPAPLPTTKRRRASPDWSQRKANGCISASQRCRATKVGICASPNSMPDTQRIGHRWQPRRKSTPETLDSGSCQLLLLWSGCLPEP